MKILVLNGSPRQNGTVASLLKAVTEPLLVEHEKAFREKVHIERHSYQSFHWTR